MYEFVEIVGILLDNAAESLQQNDLERTITVEIYDDTERYKITVKNPVKGLTNSELQKFFVRGYSTKGEGRGLGLAKIKEYKNRFKYDIFVEICNIEKIDWISFSIIKNKI